MILTKRGLTLLMIALLCAGQSLSAQNSAPRDQSFVTNAGSGVVRGRVVVAGSGAPLRRAAVRLGSGSQGRLTLTGDDGQFEFRNVAAGAYRATASQPGYLSDEQGQPGRQPTARTLEIADGQILERIDFALEKASIVTVRVLDTFGEPLSGADIQLHKSRNENGERRLDRVPLPNNLRVTNDLGELRLFTVAPGEYYVLSSVRDSMLVNNSRTNRTYVSTYYPGTVSIDEAQPIAIGPGQEISIEMMQVVVTDALTPAEVSAQPSSGRSSQKGGLIRGRVTAADTGAPLVRAQVRMIPRPGRDVLVTTDLQGRYELHDIRAGRYRVFASRNGYVGLEYGQRQRLEPGQWVELKGDEILDDIDLRLPRAGVVSVRVTDEGGEPVEGARVEALQPRWNVVGIRGLSPVVSSGPATTDDRGEVRLSGLASGEYYVSASVTITAFDRRDDRHVYAQTYYPGTRSSADAVRVFVGGGREQALTLPLASLRAADITGVVRRSDDSALRRPSVFLAETIGARTSSAVVQPNGDFIIQNVLPGEYSLMVVDQDAQRPESDEFATVRVTVAGEDISVLPVTTAKGGSARGSVTFDSATPDDMRAGVIRLMAEGRWASGMLIAPRNATVRPDGTFSVDGLYGQRVLRLFPTIESGGWFLKNVVLDGKDVTDTPLDFDGGREAKGFEVILTRKRSGVSGDVRDSSGQLVRAFAVVVFPDDERQWTPASRFIAAGRADQQGRFKIDGMPDGDYLVAAVEYLESGEERDPELLRQLRSRATRLTLGEGETRTISLRLQGR
jgi:protocatechuate 3,4-dioxygenase beta subunit